MKQKFSPKWKASKQARKQRKYSANAPVHVKRGMMSVHLSKELRKKHGKRAVVVRKNDTVKIARGSFKGRQGKVAEVRAKERKIYIEGMQKGRRDGTQASSPFEPSNLIIINLGAEDKKRAAALERGRKK